MSARKAFKGNTLSGAWEDDTYKIWSYSTLMAEIMIYRGEPLVTYIDRQKYSVTTSKHQNYIWQALNCLHFSEQAVTALNGTF
jgi:hypothetical protein